MPVALTIHAGAMNRYVSVGMCWEVGAVRGAQGAPAREPAAAAPVVDIAPRRASAQGSLAPGAVLAYAAPSRPGEAPRLIREMIAPGQLIDVIG